MVITLHCEENLALKNHRIPIRIWLSEWRTKFTFCDCSDCYISSQLTAMTTRLQMASILCWWTSDDWLYGSRSAFDSIHTAISLLRQSCICVGFWSTGLCRSNLAETTCDLSGVVTGQLLWRPQKPTISHLSIMPKDVTSEESRQQD